MRPTKLAAAAASLVLTAAPVAAGASSAEALSLSNASLQEDVRAEDTTPVRAVALIASAAGIGYLFLDGVGLFDDDNSPTSP